jgi:low temperature requirement protein LtrA
MLNTFINFLKIISLYTFYKQTNIIDKIAQHRTTSQTIAKTEFLTKQTKIEID